jgi:RNA polymerase sigma factor (TIGR02999 family)
MSEITRLLRAWNEGDPKALDKLMPLIDQELRKIAHNYMRNERPGHVLQTTALINEALLKLIQENIVWKNRKQFYFICAKRMRQVLIDYARKGSAVRRGNWAEQIDFEHVENETSRINGELVLLEEALNELAKIDERKVIIVECRFFIGLSLDEIAELLGVSSTTVERDWQFAKSWLKREMSS